MRWWWEGEVVVVGGGGSCGSGGGGYSRIRIVKQCRVCFESLGQVGCAEQQTPTLELGYTCDGRLGSNLVLQTSESSKVLKV